MEPGATGDIAICVQRRKGDIGVPIWLWLGGAWVDVATLTAQQFSAYVDNRLAAATNPNAVFDTAMNALVPVKIDGLTITRTQY